MISVSGIRQRLERLEEHCKIEATKLAQLWSMHEGMMALQVPHVVPPSPATRPGEAGVRSDAEPWKTYNPLPVSRDVKALEESLQSVRERAITYAKAIDAMTIERESLKARVAELESQLESVADRAAAAETALDSAPAASGAVNRMADTVDRLEAMSQDPGRTVAWEEFDDTAAAPAASGEAGTEAIRELVDASVCLPHCGGERLQRAIAAAKGLLTQPRPAVPASGAAGTEVGSG